MPNTYALSAWVFTRGLGLVYLCAFASLAREARGLWGSRGVLPIAEFLSGFGPASPLSRWLEVPSLFWLNSSDGWITGLTLVGALAAILATLGVATGPMLLACFFIYLSYVTVGRVFLSFQWDILLLEVGFLALFAVPWSPGWTLRAAPEPHALVRAAMYFLVFKLMFLSGVVKIASGDPAWRDLSASRYHFWTQPLPNALAPFAHAAPPWVHRVNTFLTFVVELGFPFLILWPRTRVVAALGFTALSIFIAATGNYTFFNYLTIVLCAWLVPDDWWFGLGSRLGLESVAAPATPNPLTALVMTALLLANVYWCTREWLPRAAHAVLTPVVRVLNTFYLSNSYGLFAVMTKSRPEIVIEGSENGTSWIEYEFKFKPGPNDRRPPFIAPLQPRLDWQMWFAALGSFRQNPFVTALMARLFEASPDVLAFFVRDPFPNSPPRYLRARLYEYQFKSPGEIWATGEWWSREPRGEYSPTFQR